MMLGDNCLNLYLITFAEPCSMQYRISLIVAFVVLAVVSCLMGTVLMPNSSQGGEKAKKLEAANVQAEENKETQPDQKTDEQPKKESQPQKQPAEINTDIDTSNTKLVPVETDMHEFMEYVFQPSFKRLKPAMEKEPVDNAGWKAIKAEALTLAEGGNLILMRAPEKNQAIWNLHTVKVRGHGRILYQAAKAKNFKLASQHYRLMVTSCNACHLQFAGGEHILTW